MPIASLYVWLSPFLGWPLVAASLVTLFLLRFRAPITRLIDRIESANLFGQTINAPVQEANQGADASAEYVEEQTELFAEVVELYEETEREKDAAQQEHEQVLQRLAVAELRADFEYVYGHIYQSQIGALRTLRAAGAPQPQSALEYDLDQWKNTYRAVPWIQALRFSEWIGFLIRNQLVSMDAGTTLYSIETKGLAFLGYIEGLQYPERVP